MMAVNSGGYVRLSQPRNTRAVEKKTLAPHSWRTRLRVPRRLSSRRLEFVHFWSRMFRPLDDDKLQEASIQVGL